MKTHVVWFLIVDVERLFRSFCDLCERGFKSSNKNQTSYFLTGHKAKGR